MLPFQEAQLDAMVKEYLAPDTTDEPRAQLGAEKQEKFPHVSGWPTSPEMKWGTIVQNVEGWEEPTYR